MNVSESAKNIYLKLVNSVPKEDWAACLESECRGDTEVLEIVQSMLDAHQTGNGQSTNAQETDVLLERAFASRLSEKPATEIGPYKIREKIGEGGMGVVYAAEQTEPVRRKVAIKIIKPGMDTKEVIARFEAERQALAYMEHPNIARVLDAGATESGRSYFVMELVRGIPITHYCDQAKATPRERLELFKTVCDAVQHAHQKGIIHRDIKPSNVLVTQVSAKPIVKVIDFGLAKATSGQKLTDKTVYTGFMRLMGTPVYMSPEQAGLSGLDIDTRSDIYSLGVLLFELLTGTTPLDKTESKKKAYDELCRQIREVEVPKPSARISTLDKADSSTVAERRQVDTSTLRQMLKGDLDRVVIKALQKDRDQRYDTPRDLAADIDRFLTDQPVLAVPPSQLYLAKKYFRRHRFAILTGSLIGLMLLLATAFSMRQAFVATNATKRLGTEKQKLKDALDAAEASEKEAQIARDDAIAAQKKTAELTIAQKRLLYTSDMRHAAQLWDSPNSDLRKIEEILASWVPTNDSQEDLRDFTWRFQWSQLHKNAKATVLGASGATISADGRMITADEKGIRMWDSTGTLGTPKWKGDASDVTFSPNGEWAVVLTANKAVLVKISSGQQLLEIPHPLCMFSATGNLVYGWSNTVQKIDVWDISSGAPKPLPPVITDPEYKLPGDKKVLLSDDGQSYLQRLIPNYSSSSVFLEDKSKPIEIWNRNSNHGACWSPDGRMIVSGSFTGIAQLRLLADSFREKWMIGAYGNSLKALRFSSDGRTLATGGGNGMIDLWDVSKMHELSQEEDVPFEAFTTFSPKFIRSIKAHLHPVKSIDFSSDGRKFASFCDGGVAKLWDLDSVEGFYEVEHMAENLVNGGLNIRLMPAIEEGIVVERVSPARHPPIAGTIKAGDRIFQMTDEATGKTINCAEHSFINLLRSSRGPVDSRVRLTVSSDGEEKREVVLRREKLDPRSFRVAFSPDGKTIAVGDMVVGAATLNLETGQTKRYPSIGLTPAFSPNGRLLAIPTWTHIEIWDLKQDELFDRLRLFTEEEEASLPKTNNPGGTIAFSPDGKFLAIGTGYSYGHGNLSNLKVWRVGTGSFETVPGPERDDIVFRNDCRLCTLAFTPDSSQLIVGDSKGKVRVWRTSDWQIDRTFDTGHRRVWGLAISSQEVDGKKVPNILATGGGGSLILWDYQSGKKRRAISTPEPMVLAFSPDGNSLVSGTSNHKVILWDVNSGTPLRTFHDHTDGVCGAAFSPDGETLATVGTEGVLRLRSAATFQAIENYPMTRVSTLRLGELRNKEGRFSDAETILRRLFQLQRRLQDSGDGMVTEAEIEKTKSAITDSMRSRGLTPVLVRQPESVTGDLGDKVQMSVELAKDGPWSLQWFRNGQPIDGAISPKLEVEIQSQADYSAYQFVAAVKGRSDVYPVRSDIVFVTEKGVDQNQGLRWEVFNDIEGVFVSDLTDTEKFIKNEHDEEMILEHFEIPSDVGNNYGGRITGWLVPPVTGEYVFYLCSDDQGQLFLSETESPDGEKMIAFTRWSKKRNWQAKPAAGKQGRSVPIHLERGKRYSIRALVKEGEGEDYLGVAWRLPGQQPPEDEAAPIPGLFLRHQLE